jgi:hypothetical protein
MKYIANIITHSKLDVSNFFNVTCDFYSVDTNLPTIIIGWNNVKELFPEQDILTKKISDTISWTFSKREKRHQYEKDIDVFIKGVISSLDDKINYKFFNYILSTQQKRERFISYINKGECSIYHNSRFLYVYCHTDNITLGISLRDLFYVGVDAKSFVKLLNVNGNNIITDNLNFLDNQSLGLLKDNIKVAAYLNYLKNSDIYKETER